MNSTILVSFTEEDFKGNTYTDGSDCALTRAVSRKVNVPILSGGGYFRFRYINSVVRFTIPDDVEQSIQDKFDNTRKPLPASFLVEIPTEYVKEIPEEMKPPLAVKRPPVSAMKQLINAVISLF